MFTLRDDNQNAERMCRLIRRALEPRHAMHIGELCTRLGAGRPEVQVQLDAMIQGGEVERLRPIEYPGDDRDFFRMNRPPSAAARLSDRKMWRTAADWQLTVMQAGDTMACLVD